MYSVAVVEPNKLKIVELEKPVLGPYDVLVKTEAAFICNATDKKVVEGHFPGLGLENYPLLLGHESVGRIVEKGENASSFTIGNRAIGGLLLDPPGGTYGSGWGGNSEYILMRDHQAMVDDGVADELHGWNDSLQIMREVPEDITLEDAGLLCTWREVYAGMFTDFSLKPGDDIIVFGAGPVGLSFIKFAKLKGLGEVISVDPLPNKREKALAMGADAAYAPEDPQLAALKEIRGDGFDAIIDAVGHESIINQAIPLIKMAGSICVYGVVGAPTITLQKHLGPYNFNLLIHQWPTREAEAGAQDTLIEWIHEGKLDYRDFVTGVFPVKDFEEAFAAVQKPDSIKTMLILDQWT
ncbi:MAG: zinc-binding dehydrogenase [Bacteroidetes bacterium]|nr:zinc-binding dehydrogenase [Bacteroidota bacterium]